MPKTNAKPKRPRGRPAWEPTAEQRMMVKVCMGTGFTQEQVAALLGVDHDTLVKHCREELAIGHLEIDAKIGGKLVQKCLAGDTACLIFYHKTRRGWSEKQRHEHSGPDGAPIAQVHGHIEITAEMTQQQAAEAYTKMLGG